MRLIGCIIIIVLIAGGADFCKAQLPVFYQVDEIKIYDTQKNFKNPYTPIQVQNKQDWKQITEPDFSGDLCLENSRMVLILRKYAAGPEAYYKIGPLYSEAFTLAPLADDDDPLVRVQSCEIINIDQAQVHLKTSFETKSEKPVTLDYFIKPYRTNLEIRPGTGVRKLSLKSVSRYIIVPDLYADDLLIDPLAAKLSRLYLPEDNHLFLQMKDDGNAIIICNWLANDDPGEMELTLGSTSRQRLNTETVIDLDNKDVVWVSVLAYVGIWHHLHSSELNVYEQVPLKWVIPFRASWRADYQRVDRRAAGLTDSFWNAIMLGNGTFMSAPGLMEMQIIDGQYVIEGSQEIKRLVRRSVVNEYIGNGWWPFLGWFLQPFYTSGNRAFMKLPKYDQLATARYSGPIVIYPLLDEIAADPASQTVEDVWRDTLGAGYLDLLDLADLNRRPEEDYYPPTCFTTEYCEDIFEALEEVPRREHIVSMLEQMKVFVSNTRRRLEAYVDWQEDIQFLYHEMSSAEDPNLVPVVRVMENVTLQLTRRYDQERSKMRTPSYAADLADRVINLIDDRSFSKIARCKQTCSRIRDIGDTQDELLGELRDIMKIARQRAGVLHTRQTDPHVRKFLRLVRARTKEILRISYDMEGKQ
ncbi:MAG: hypothetical protein AMJ79_11295 [Phycisphaerae bacterium SM23_30]|nr:MAG: hypothetical protein AMJ79_11295 [Phycisphaerae bacterium SM23_30]